MRSLVIENRTNWAIALFAGGAAAMFTTLAPGAAKVAIVIALATAAALFIVAAHLAKWLQSISRAAVSLLIIGVAVSGWGWFVWPRIQPQIAIIGYQVALFEPHRPCFANLLFQNLGGEGTITVFSAASFALATANPADIKKELYDLVKKTAAENEGLHFTLKPQEKNWFTVFGAVPTAPQRKLLKTGKYAFYFSGTILNGSNGKNYEFCNFVEGNKPNVIIECPE